MQIKKFTIRLLLLAMASTAFIGFASAQSAPSYPGGGANIPPADEGTGGTAGTGNQLICRGDRDWGTFISSVLSYDDFSEYWKDILDRYSSNICHYMDIDGVLNRVNKAREQIRKSFYVCGNTQALKKTYYTLEAELFFLRKYVDTDNGNFLVKNPEELRADLRNNFVFNKGFFTNEEIDLIFEEFKTKYDNRLDAYQNCKDPGWEELVNKWQEFKDNVLILFTDPANAPVIKAATESIQKKWDRMAAVDMNLGRSFFGGFLDARINGLEPKQGLDQIGAELKKNTPQGGYTFDQLKAAETVVEQNYNYQKLEVDYMTQYQTLYKEVSDTVNNELMLRLENLDLIIKTTFPFENQTVQCLKAINNKQC